MVNKIYRCAYCGKKFNKLGFKAVMHAAKELPRALYYLVRGKDKMGKLVIKDCKLVPEEEVQNEQVIEEKKQKVFVQPAPKEQPVQEEVEIEVEQPVKEVEPVNEVAETKAEMKQRIYEELKAELLAEEKAKLQAYEQSKVVKQNIEDEYKEELRQQELRHTQTREQEEKIEQLNLSIVLLNNLKISINVAANEMQNLYDYMCQSMETSKIVKIENKVIPVSSIAMFYFE
jgi:hypothetical protein